MALDPSYSSNLEQLALKGLILVRPTIASLTLLVLYRYMIVYLDSISYNVTTI